MVLFLYPRPNSLGFPFLSKINGGLVSITIINIIKNIIIETNGILFLTKVENILILYKINIILIIK
jgi:hypothetical protein